MNWFLWMYLIVGSLSVAARIALIGVPRRPYGRGEVALLTIVDGLVIFGVLYYGMR